MIIENPTVSYQSARKSSPAWLVTDVRIKAQDGSPEGRIVDLSTDIPADSADERRSSTTIRFHPPDPRINIQSKVQARWISVTTF
jgi:hypothetical protein